MKITSNKKVHASKRIQDWAKKQESIKAESMFGHDSFFTRDDEIEYIEIPLEDKLRHDETYGFTMDTILNFRAYIDEDTKTIEVDCQVDDVEFTISTHYDMRKIRKPSDLQRYMSSLSLEFYDNYKKYVENIEACEITGSDQCVKGAKEVDSKPVPLKSLKKGDWFTLKPIAEPKDNQVYIKDDYDREEKKFMCGRCDDISYTKYLSGDKLVYTDFIY